MKYKGIKPITRYEAEEAFAQGTSEQIIDALLRITFYDEDWRWVQAICLAFLETSDAHIQNTAILCLGHLARIHGVLDLGIVLPALQSHISDNALAGRISDAFDDISLFIKDRLVFVEIGDTLPSGMRNALIRNGVFNEKGDLK